MTKLKFKIIEKINDTKSTATIKSTETNKRIIEVALYSDHACGQTVVAESSTIEDELSSFQRPMANVCVENTIRLKTDNSFSGVMVGFHSAEYKYGYAYVYD